MSPTGVKPVFGGGFYAVPRSDAEIAQSYALLAGGGCTAIDTAHLYRDSEQRLGETGGGARFTIDSKAPGGLKQGTSSAAEIVAYAEESLRKLGVAQLDIFYLHAPDPTAPLEGVCRGFNEAHARGYFRRFGLSNFTAAQVRETHAIAAANGWVRPSVYQGSYSAVARLQETEILPTVRELGMAFYAYSPMAGGLLTKTAAQIRGQGADAGRYSKESPILALYGAMYNRPSMLRGLEAWAEAAALAGCGRAELAYRWVAFDSALDAARGDAVIFGASSLGQAEETLAWFGKGSVGKEARAKIEELWESVRAEATLNNTDEHGVLHGTPAS